MIVWIVGLSGVGKTTVGSLLVDKIRENDPTWVMIDGDAMRSIFGSDKANSDYSIESRRQNAKRIVSLCVWLDRQKINVVCNILCIFDDLMKNNKELFPEYFQVELTAPMDVLVERDTKGIYSGYINGFQKNVVGFDIKYDKPTHSDLVIDNSGVNSPVEVVDKIFQKLFFNESL